MDKESLALTLRSIKGLAKTLSAKEIDVFSLETDSLQKFCRLFAPLFVEARAAGDLINVWAVAGLKRNELRHAAVLAWLLDASETHGFDSAILKSWISSLENSIADTILSSFSESNRYRVRTECSPLSDEQSRVDIEVESEAALILIEVKVDAAEGPDQIANYLKLAEAKAAGRPFMVIFLSRVLDPFLSADSDRIIKATWSSLANSITSAASARNHNLPARLVLQFADHIRRL